MPTILRKGSGGKSFDESTQRVDRDVDRNVQLRLLRLV